MPDLEEVITHHREALTLFPPGHLDRSISLNNLAHAIHTRYQQSGRMEDIEEVIKFHREAVTLCPPGHLNYFKSSATLPVQFLLAISSLAGWKTLMNPS
jgi:hypothetical protein